MSPLNIMCILCGARLEASVVPSENPVQEGGHRTQWLFVLWSDSEKLASRLANGKQK